MKNKHNKIAKEIKTTEPLKDKSTKKKKTTRSNDNSLIKMHSTSSFIDHIDTRKKNKSIKLHTSPSPLTKSLSKEKRQSPKPINKSILRQKSVQSFQPKLPWGCNEGRMKNYVLETLMKMNKLRNTQKTKTKEDLLQEQPIERQDKQKIAGVSIRERKLKTMITPEKQSNEKMRSKELKSYEEEEKTSKKESSFASESKCKKQKFSKLIRNSFSKQFQKIQQNNLFIVHFRVMKGSIIEFKVDTVKKIDTISISLKKGSLECQSINQKYSNLMAKATITLMSPVYFIKSDNFAYPELHFVVNERNGTFSYQKNVLLPYSWLHLIEPLTPGDLKNFKSSKIKNKSVIEQGIFKKFQLQTLINIFQGSYVRALKQKTFEYKFGFSYMKNTYIIRYHEKGSSYSLQCEMNGKGESSEVLKYFDFILNF